MLSHVCRRGTWTVIPRVLQDSSSVPICGFRRLDLQLCLLDRNFPACFEVRRLRCLADPAYVWLLQQSGRQGVNYAPAAPRVQC
jgi:hypothetical protein